jgi:hypothetical protein
MRTGLGRLEESPPTAGGANAETLADLAWACPARRTGPSPSRRTCPDPSRAGPGDNARFSWLPPRAVAPPQARAAGTADSGRATATRGAAAAAPVRGKALAARSGAAAALGGAAAARSGAVVLRANGLGSEYRNVIICFLFV